jgi:hypothetical protein
MKEKIKMRWLRLEDCESGNEKAYRLAVGEKHTRIFLNVFPTGCGYVGCLYFCDDRKIPENIFSGANPGIVKKEAYDYISDRFRTFRRMNIQMDGYMADIIRGDI